MEATLEERIRAELADGAERTGPPEGAVPVPPIPVERYRDPAFFALEQERLWGRTWLFAGHESELAEPGSYRLFTRSGAPILIVRGHDGVVRAFYNSCRHRGAPVVRDDCGVAKRLTCQYHSWSYDTVGELRAVPDSRSFAGLDESDLGLVPVRCESWQGFLFVTEDPDAPALTDYLGPLTEQMAEIDGSSLRVLGRQNHHIECNWKLLVDAFVEVYHIRTVHPDNAALLYDDRRTTVAMLPNGHSRLTVAKKEEMIPFVAPSPEADNPSVGALWRETSTSFGIFPNIVAPMDTGAFAWICMWPDGQRATDLELVWFAPAWGEGEPLEEHLMRMTLFETVMAQDTANMNAIQRSVDSRGAQPFQIGWHERLIHHFHRSLDLAIGDVPDGCAVSDALDGRVEQA
ncbi:aromatic ring-hydroxylating oxygenase subunit alpha [Actinospongicola halichondriae]|uniref:aromatic ring-hydroxylating oxygenase subunit alpha n=1 Tax=Actinospongicola halichondriae TaxID=3236844 RepID=UPI003D4CF6CB